MIDTSELFSLGLLFFAAMAAGAVNSIAGGGSLISFPALLAYGATHNISQKMANATNNAGLVPGSVAGMIGYWEEVKRSKRLVLFLAIPSVIGGLLGALLLSRTPEAIFQRLVPWLILFATLLFAGRDVLTRIFRRGNDQTDHITLGGGAIGFIFQLVIATYGGYFGAGQSIMMMAAFSIMGVRDIYEINGLKTTSAVLVNSVALIFFATQGLIVWYVGIIMGVGAVIGGYFAARVSKRIDQKVLRWAVIAIGLIVSAILFLRQ